MSVYPSLSQSVGRGPVPYIHPTDISIGNAGNGGQPNPPTIVPQMPGTFPRVNLNPKFKIGEYNNAEESYNFPRFTKYWEMQRNTNNPIGNYGASAMGLGVPGSAANGYNKATQGRTPMPWAPYNPRVLGVQGGFSQSYAYNENQTTLEGSLLLRQPLGFNVNMGEEQMIGAGMAVPTFQGTIGGMDVNIRATMDDGMKEATGGGRRVPKNLTQPMGSNATAMYNDEIDSRVGEELELKLLRDRLLNL